MTTEKDVFSNHILQFPFPLTFSKDQTGYTFILRTVRNRPSGSCQESVFFHPETISLFRAMFPDSPGFHPKHWTRNSEDKMKSANFKPLQVTVDKQTLICPLARLYLTWVLGYYPKYRSFLAGTSPAGPGLTNQGMNLNKFVVLTNSKAAASR